MQVNTMLSDQIERYLDLSTSQIKITAENMANIDTPGYQAKAIDFEAEMRGAMDQVEHGGTPTPLRIKAEENLVSRPDGNNVSMDRESLNLAEAQLKFKAGVSFWRTQYQMVMDAIHADKS